MRIRATVRYMAASELAEMIPPGKIAEIKAIGDPNPVFKAFVIGQEGPATGYLFGIGNVVKTWYAAAIRALYSRILPETKVFQGHAADTNDHEGRVEIGYVVGKKLLTLKDKLSAVVACYLHPPFRNIPLDIASIEVEIGLRRNDRGTYVSDVGEVTGIALSNSGLDTPGFAGATLLGQLQAFANKDFAGGGGNDMGLSVEEVRAFLRQEKVKPSDVFGMDDLAADPAVRGLAEDRVKERVAGEWRGRKEAEEKLEKERGEWKKEKDGLLAKVLGLETATARTQIGPLFEKAKTDRKLSERQVKFVSARLEKFEVKDPTATQKEFDAFLDAAIIEEKKIAKDVYGLKEEEPKEKVPGAEPRDKTELEPGDDALNPETNPMIPT